MLFQVPKPGIPDPSVCGEPIVNPNCFSDVEDLGAIDIQRDRDHGIPSYNGLRLAYGLSLRSFTAITGESTDRLPAGTSPATTRASSIRLAPDGDGNPVPVGEATRTPVGRARHDPGGSPEVCLRERRQRRRVRRHGRREARARNRSSASCSSPSGSASSTAVRDGDRFFYANDDALAGDPARVRHRLPGQPEPIIKLNSDEQVADDVFKAAD